MLTGMQLLGSTVLTPLRFCSWDSVKSEVYERKVDTQHELLARNLDAAVRIKKREDRLKQDAIFAHELQSALRLTMAFPNIC
jgi:hypothetical protein